MRLDIVHGDIKPQNVLMFKDQNGMYIARVTDFGYSTVYAVKDDLIQLPLTWPWNAPEHDRHDRRCTPLEAQLADNFSLGMLFVWILFEPYLSGATKLPPEVETWAVGDFSKSRAEDTLANLKDAGTLFEFAQRMLSIEPILDDYAKARLEDFLSIHLRKGLNFHDLSVALLGDRPKTRWVLVPTCVSSEYCQDSRLEDLRRSMKSIRSFRNLISR
jgi:serine/threonine protein kinase